MNANAPDEVDELASALIDGLLDEEQATAARRDPAVAARADEMRAAQEALRAVPPADPGRRDQAIATAVRLHGPPQVRRQGSRWLAAAAVIVVLLAIGGALATWSSSSSDETATSGGESATTEATESEAFGDAAEDSAVAEEEAADEAAPAPGDGDTATDDGAEAREGAADTGENAAAFTDLGSVGSIDELAARARAAIDDPGSEQSTTTSLADVGCPTPPAVERAGGPVLRGEGTLEGEPLAVWVYEDDGSLRLLALDSSCSQRANRTLDG